MPSKKKKQTREEEQIRTRSAVRARIAFPPAFCTSVRGMTSSASATARNGPASTPVTALAHACRPTETAISTAPPPGTSVGLNTTLRATDIASAKLRSISFKMSLDGPRRRMVQAFGVVHSVRKVKYLESDEGKALDFLFFILKSVREGERKKKRVFTRHRSSRC
jgi:hypothetical protein